MQTVNGRFHRPSTLEPPNFAHKASLRAGMRRDWIIAADMEHQPFRYRLSGHDAHASIDLKLKDVAKDV
jgi:hypothetical protein